ncbi:hypothetical protein N7532_010640 [Penicillium argentinense]|uniref:Globin-sensor domain-containing protein n=1 Tax=Penicillium argentinense TaxID=1131581 RepID=A0A9W9EQD6_9EURO|nr:uncharacterized protein N7532_010640 [Penicillium argentinense]KAJ5085869.1 hypothetical protein N7532_010640 [Penicillium argentinense]
MPCDYGVRDGPKPKHIDRKAIHTSLEERIKYLHDFLEFGSADIEALASGAKYIKQLIPAVVNLVYKKLLQYDITSRAFHTRTTACEDELEEDFLHEETPQIQRRKMFLRWYLTRLCQDPTSIDFWRYLNKVGLMHCGQERMAPLNIEYVHINACMGYIQDIFIEALMSHPHLSLRRKIALVRAVNKILWIQNDLFAKWRVRDGEEYADEMSIYSFGSREGYLGDKKILGSSSGSSDDDDRSSITSVAPSTQSAAPSTNTTDTTHTAQTTQSARSGPTKSSACPFAEFSKAQSMETKIWAE